MVIGPPSKPFIEEAPKLELKDLPAHLKYALISEDNTSAIILFASLLKENVEVVLLILNKRKAALGLEMSESHGISPNLCMHKIYME